MREMDEASALAATAASDSSPELADVATPWLPCGAVAEPPRAKLAWWAAAAGGATAAGGAAGGVYQCGVAAVNAGTAVANGRGA